MSNSNLLHGIRNLLGGPRSQRQTSDYIPLSNVEPNSQPSGVEASFGGLYTHTSSNDSGYAGNVAEVEFDKDKPPSEEEKLLLRKVPDTIPLAAFTIVIVELCERFAFYGLSGVFQNYLQNPLPPGGNGSGAPASVDDPVPAGALGLGQATASRLQQIFATVAYIFPLFGAVIADAKWGRYKTITVFCAIYFIGLVIITVTSFPNSLKSGMGLPGWITGVFIVAIGTGGIKGIYNLFHKTYRFILILD